MLAIDTNILVHCHRRDSPFHREAFGRMATVASDSAPWAITWPCVHEFLSAVTHPRVFLTPSTASVAFEQIAAWRDAGAVVIGEAPDHLERLEELVRAGRMTGPRIHDARIAAICLSHGVSELWTADRDFSRFPSLGTRNPLV